MIQSNWRSRLGAWVGGFGVPGGFDAASGQRRLKGFTTLEGKGSTTHSSPFLARVIAAA